MLHPGDDDFITCLKLVRETARELVGERCHVGANQHLTRVSRAQKIGHGFYGIVIECVDLDRGRIKHASVAVVAVKKVDDAINALFGDLGARRVIKIDAALALVCCRQRGKLLSNGVDWKCHGVLSPLTSGPKATAHRSLLQRSL